MALSQSDPFATLPAELRLHIIMLTNCTKTISRLIRASPSMLAQYLGHKRYIQRHIVDYDEDMKQDVMAIILIPFFYGTDEEEPDENTLTSARTVLQEWSAGQLPDPFKVKTEHEASQLNQLHSRILLLAEDYITKATSSFPPRDYRCLPQIRRPLYNGHLMFKGVEVKSRFNFADLTSFEKTRVFKAFIRHELRCRIGSLFDDFKHLPKRPISEAESQGIYCVKDYYSSVYGAIFAQCSDAQLPSDLEGISLETQLGFPDNHHFDPNTYAHKLGLFDDWWDQFPDFALWFTRFGLDRLTDFLSYDMAKEDERQSLKVEVQEVWFDGIVKPNLGWDIPFAPISKEAELNNNGGRDSKLYKQVFPFSTRLRWEIVRQRAWVFFDDTRLYPQETTERPNFPSESFLKAESMEKTSSEDWHRCCYIMRRNRRAKLAYEEWARSQAVDDLV
ncbi:hypothetical protein FPSE_10869 [Fusarium pseudograminearum CS3096]|uniref:Uncharacterized protein n=1 Tax=Fusarium pseudograminearum (strain CS3096) TaxID=1028729 RepID=K3V730_FUSPC|nr:hypothetical protein FPSE_10869 [Fusarium pseudograminearum CS3096]EKJ68944.1 hypothetical protein FPSE_10869 [Fusarium pseudograminearum CS3096]